MNNEKVGEMKKAGWRSCIEGCPCMKTRKNGTGERMVHGSAGRGQGKTSDKERDKRAVNGDQREPT